MLRERAGLRIPPLLHDLVVDTVAFGGPPCHVGRASPQRGHPDRAVERYPGLEPAVGKVPPAAAALPDALVGLVPVLAQPVDDAGGLQPAPVGGLDALGGGCIDGV